MTYILPTAVCLTSTVVLGFIKTPDSAGIYRLPSYDTVLPPPTLRSALAAKTRSRFVSLLSLMRLNKDTNLDLVFAARAERKVGGGNTVSYEGSLYMPAESGVFIKPRTTVEVRQTAVGKIYVMHKGEAILMKTM